MKMTQVRNATLLLEVGGRRVLVDPMLGPQGSSRSFPAASGSTARNPTVDLTVPLADLTDPDLIVVTHTHPDHWDAAAASMLPRGVPVLTQHAGDADLISASGFEDVRVLSDSLEIGGTVFTRTGGQHAGDDVWDSMQSVLGSVMGVVMRHPGEPVVYIAGDSVWSKPVSSALAEHQPDVVVLNTGEARVGEGAGVKILMGLDDIRAVHRAAPRARIVAVHMEALNHCTVTRAQVRDLAREDGVAELILVPEDGEILSL